MTTIQTVDKVLDLLLQATQDFPRGSRLAAMCEMVKTRPFPRFERRGLLGLSKDSQYFLVNPALVEDLTGAVRKELRELAIRRIAEHFEQDIIEVDGLVVNVIE